MEIILGVIGSIIAVAGLFIGYSQYRLYKFQIKREMYDRRLPIFKSISDYIAQVIVHGTATQKDYVKLLQDTVDSRFLFGDEIKRHIDELFNHGVKIDMHRKLIDASREDNIKDAEYKNHCDRKAEEFEWFTKQSDKSFSLFKRYLQLTKRLT